MKATFIIICIIVTILVPAIVVKMVALPQEKLIAKIRSECVPDTVIVSIEKAEVRRLKDKIDSLFTEVNLIRDTVKIITGEIEPEG